MPETDPATPTRIAFALMPRFNMLSLAAALEPMRVANYLAPQPLYRWEFLSDGGGAVAASNGMRQETTDLAAGAVPEVAYVLGSWGGERFDSPALTRWLRRAASRGAALVGVELGLYPLARAGLLGERQATTHWAWLAGFAEQFPRVRLREQLYTVDGNILSCAGGTGPLDLGLMLIARRHGEPLALAVAEQVLHPPRRAAETPQRHTLGAATGDVPAELRAAIRLIEEHIAEPLAVPEVARRTALSQRGLERLFRRHVGCSAVQFGLLVRLQHARVLLTSTRLSIRDVSAATGFNSLSYFSQSFVRCFGRKPSAYRQTWPEHEPAPSWPGTLADLLARLPGPGARAVSGRRG